MADAMRDHLVRTYAMTLDMARKLTDDVACDDCAKLPHAAAKHPAWVLGHHAVAAGMAAPLLGAEAGVPADLGAVCGNGTEPSADRATYPKKAELLSMLETSHAALTEAVLKADDATLAAELPIPEFRSFFPTNGDAVFYLMAHHEGYHLGQLSMWRRTAGFGAAT